MNKKTARPPVVVVMGHIDHGKSTLLDYIRKENTTDKESGGITQHVSAYEATTEIAGEKKTITFLDTPGHEAFYAIRERGSRVADIAILIVSAEDGVKPQTVEALNYIKKNSLPFIVAISKIDKPGANIDKVKQDLAEREVFVEGWGGTVPCAPISSKTGEGVSELLELITLQADLEELVGESDTLGSGFVVECDLNPKQGVRATLVIKDGSIRSGLFLGAPGAYVSVRNIENSAGVAIESATFSSPVKIVGWSGTPKVGGQFQAFKTKDEALEYSQINDKINESKTIDTNENGIAFPIVIKADTFGSLDAIEHEFKKLGNEKIFAKIVSRGVGAISESDIKTANIKKSPVIGFSVIVDKNAETLALRDKVEVKIFKIIYELVEYVHEKMKEATPIEMIESITGSGKILKVFSKNKDKQVVGARVESGEIGQGEELKILRRDAVIGHGMIRELQVQKIKSGRAKEGDECGLMIESKIELVPGDRIEAVRMVKA